MNLTLEQRAFLVYLLGNFGTGMIFVIMLSPQLIDNILAYIVLLVAGIFELLLMSKMNLDAYRYGLVEGFKRNSRYKTQLNPNKQSENKT